MSELSEFDQWYAKELFGDDSAKFKYIKAAYHNLEQLARAVIKAHWQCPIFKHSELCATKQFVGINTSTPLPMCNCEPVRIDRDCTCPDCVLAREVLGVEG